MKQKIRQDFKRVFDNKLMRSVGVVASVLLIVEVVIYMMHGFGGVLNNPTSKFGLALNALGTLGIDICLLIAGHLSRQDKTRSL